MQNAPQVGDHVVITKLAEDGTKGMFVKDKHLRVRRERMVGTVLGWVTGHGGDVWWVQHLGYDEIGAYCYTEFELRNL
jgi:hypothetical protein